MSGPAAAIFSPWVENWTLAPDGDPITTPAARLLPVRLRGAPAMLKISDQPEEIRGAAALDWWEGRGAARVLLRDGAAIVMERACGTRALDAMARGGADAEATRILCDAVEALHAGRRTPPDDFISLTTWFRALEPMGRSRGGLLALASDVARELLAGQREIVALHGDIHHGNVLDFGGRGWLAIDPKGLVGERAFDYANIFCNPVDDPQAVTRARFLSRLDIVCARAGVERERMLRWTLAWAGLSAAWLYEDGAPAENAVAVMSRAAGELGLAA